jgi:hypothetical protein
MNSNMGKQASNRQLLTWLVLALSRIWKAAECWEW